MANKTLSTVAAITKYETFAV